MTGLRSALIKNLGYITTAKLPFSLKRHRKTLWNKFREKTLNLAVLIVDALKLCVEKCYIDSLSDLEKKKR